MSNCSESLSNSLTNISILAIVRRMNIVLRTSAIWVSMWSLLSPPNETSHPLCMNVSMNHECSVAIKHNANITAECLCFDVDKTDFYVFLFHISISFSFIPLIFSMRKKYHIQSSSQSQCNNHTPTYSLQHTHTRIYISWHFASNLLQFCFDCKSSNFIRSRIQREEGVKEALSSVWSPMLLRLAGTCCCSYMYGTIDTVSHNIQCRYIYYWVIRTMENRNESKGIAWNRIRKNRKGIHTIVKCIIVDWSSHLNIILLLLLLLWLWWWLYAQLAWSQRQRIYFAEQESIFINGRAVNDVLF